MVCSAVPLSMVSLEGFLRGFRAKNRGLTIDIDKIG